MAGELQGNKELDSAAFNARMIPNVAHGELLGMEQAIAAAKHNARLEELGLSPLP